MLVIQPFGHIEDRLLKHLKTHLKTHYGEVQVNDELELPDNSWSEYRKQYLVDPFMQMLKDVPGDRVLGIVDRDLYSPELNFIFGQARINGRYCIVAIERLREGVGPKQFLDRVLKEAIHELGHTKGLRHCKNKPCVMQFSNTLEETDDKGPNYCSGCRDLLK